MERLLTLADRRPLALAAAAFSFGLGALLVSVPPITEDLTPPPPGASHR